MSQRGDCICQLEEILNLGKISEFNTSLNIIEIFLDYEDCLDLLCSINIDNLSTTALDALENAKKYYMSYLG